MFTPELITAIDAAVPNGVTHIGLMALNLAGEVLVIEPPYHPYGVSATFAKVSVRSDEQPHATLARCIQEQIDAHVVGVYPIPAIWITGQSRGFYFAALMEGPRTQGSAKGISWEVRSNARQQIEASKKADSRQRDLGLLEAVATMQLCPYRRILLMLQELHRMGFERLRAPTYLYPNGWRCPIVPSIWTSRDHGGVLEAPMSVPGVSAGNYTYGSGTGQSPFGWTNVAFASPRELALRFLHERPELALAGWGPDQAYVEWFDLALALTAPNGLFYTAGDYEPATDFLYTWRMAEGSRVPLPPPGLAEPHAFANFRPSGG